MYIDSNCFRTKTLNEDKNNAKVNSFLFTNNRYLETLIKQDVISYDPINHTFDITQKGRKVLMLNQQLATYISPVKEMIRKYACFMEVPFFDTNVMEDTKIMRTTL